MGCADPQSHVIKQLKRQTLFFTQGLEGLGTSEPTNFLVFAFSPSSQEAEAVRSEFQASLVYKVSEQPGLHLLH